MNEEFLSQREAKQRRLAAIEEIVQAYPIRTQEELVVKLKEGYGIDTNQAAISRDIKDLELVKDRLTNCYTLNEKAKQNMERERLQNLMFQAEAVFCDYPLDVMMLKTDPAYSHLIAATIETLFSTEKNPIGTFIGSTGTLLLVASKEQKQAIQEELRTIFVSEVE
ncbi:hypothetical protein P9G84_16475 [Brevibacillus centrosporus]|uniref:hypothetical protein n=1 Tax=Brevibacillus centrosporus TaxID=54910 RepID=UPI000F0A0A52|nr:hypothetical protein [Brevibacillus centrosporus]MEC2130530.1 hypothetical protein [Brevibacillus centrosporus]RNB68868.1 hypothetical protein EDM55_15765 [Brevibacillus centrosporus]GED34936.1 arginine repressor [Brevibacillus centrosporus]